MAMAALGDMTPAYPGVAELTRQLDQEKIAMLSQRVDDLRNQNQDLKVPARRLTLWSSALVCGPSQQALRFALKMW